MLDQKFILKSIETEIKLGQLKLPGLPDIAEKVRSAVRREDFHTGDLAKIIQTDIPLTARLVQIANSPLYRGVKPVDHCHEAVSRLGLNVTRNLVTSFALRRLFSETTGMHGDYINKLWKYTVKVAAISFTLARITPGLDPDRAMLAGLIHDIGILILLSYAQKYPVQIPDIKTLEWVAERTRAELGATILRAWRFEQDFITVAEECDQWKRDPQPKPDYCDVVIIARIHAVYGKSEQHKFPSLNQIKATNKFPIFKFGSASSMELLKQAQDEISEIQRLLLNEY